jgi:hypothetical protein
MADWDDTPDWGYDFVELDGLPLEVEKKDAV